MNVYLCLRVVLAQSSRAAKNFGEPLTFYTTLLLERAVGADSRTVQRQSFSHVKATRQGRSLR
jgi:hypothetical protein